MTELATTVRNTFRAPKAAPDAPTFEVLTTPNAKQRRALELLQQIRLSAEAGPPISHHMLVMQGQTCSALGGTSE
jgi:hypothetical protein